MKGKIVYEFAGYYRYHDRSSQITTFFSSSSSAVFGNCTSTVHFLRIALLVFTAIRYLSTSRSRTVHLPVYSNCFALALLIAAGPRSQFFSLPPTSFTLSPSSIIIE